MKPGDLVSIDNTASVVGIVLELTKRLYIPAAKILLKGEVVEFDIEELWCFYESR